MSYKLYRMMRVGLASTAVVGGACALLSNCTSQGQTGFTVSAKSVNDLHMGMDTKWNQNWDLREPTSLLKPLPANATDQEKETYQEKLKHLKPKATRVIVLVRHGQYNLQGLTDNERYLTQLGKKQADMTGKRLAELYEHFLTQQKNDPAKVCISIVKSTMTRATETADIIHKHLAHVPIESCDLIREGLPCKPEPDMESWIPQPSEFFVEGARIEAAFRKYFHRAEPEQEDTSVEIMVCHGNVIRYFICRALQFDPSGWLRMAVHNGSITVMNIRPNGRVSITQVGDTGHFPAPWLTFN